MKKQNILWIAVIFFWFAQYVYIPYQTPYLASISTASNFIGIIVGAYGFSQMALRLPVGIMADSKDYHKAFIIIGAISSGLASVLRFLIPNGTGFLLANLFSGLASAMWISFMVLYMSYFKDQQKATSQIVLANNLGMLLGFITSTLLYEIVGMRIICLFSVISGIISALLATRLPVKKTETKNVRISSLLKVCTQKQLIVFSLFALIQQGIQQSTTMSFTNTIIKDLGASSFLVGFSSIVYMCSSVFWANMASKSFVTKRGPKFWVPLVFLTTAIYCVTVPNCPWIPIIILLQILPGLATGVLYSYCTSEAMKYVPKEKKSTAMGFYQAVYALGMTLMPILCGQIVEVSSMKMAYYVLALILICTSGLSKIFYIKKK